MNLQQAALIAGVVSSAIPVVGAYLRRRSRFVTASSILTACAFSIFLLILLKLLAIGPSSGLNVWVYLLIGSTFPILISTFSLSASIGRENPEGSFRRLRRTFALLGAAGAISLIFIKHPSFLVGFDWDDGRGTIHLGGLGKAYVSYLLVGIVLIGYNLESTFRVSPSELRYRLKLPFLAFFGLLGYLTFVLTTGILYSSIGLGKLTAFGVPITLFNVLLGYGFLRGALSDVAAPVSRNVVYSSFTALAAGLYVLAVGLAAQIATFTNWSPDEVVILSFGFLAILVAILLLFSNRFQRRARRFIDRNFYVNRYDYRTQWSNVTSVLEDAVEREDVLDRTSRLVREVFLADEFTIALRDEASQVIRPFRGKGAENTKAALEAGSPLYQRLVQTRNSMLLDRMPHDFEYIPIYAENSRWLEETASMIVAPILDGESLVGTIGLERGHQDDPFTFEDVALLESVTAHVSASLRSAKLAREIGESRELELMSQWSNMILHDMKNYLAPLRMVAENLVNLADRPKITEISARDLNRVADRMDELVRTLSELKENPGSRRENIDPNRLIEDTLSEMQLARRPSISVEMDLQSTRSVRGDRSMLQRVMENLATNAIDAMEGDGTLTIRTSNSTAKGNGQELVHIEVADTGIGIPDQFLRENLFRPFATTKKKGLGLGLYQCRSIIRDHGGELTARSTVGMGTTFTISLHAIVAAPVPELTIEPEPSPSGALS